MVFLGQGRKQLIAAEQYDGAQLVQVSVFLYGMDHGEWKLEGGGSSAVIPIRQLEAADIDGNGEQELIVLEKEGSYMHLAAWEWNGWGFDLLLLLVEHELFGDLFSLHFIVDGRVRARNDRDVKLLGHFFGIDFIAEVFDHLPVGADKCKHSVADGDPAGKAMVFGKKAVTRMDGRALGMIGHSENIVGVCIAGDSPSLMPFAVKSDADMLGIFVSRCIDNGEIKVKIFTGPHDTQGDFAAVGY